MHAFLNGKRCLLYGLALCSTPTVDSGLRVLAYDLGYDKTKIVVYGGQCYSYLCPETCGTILTAGSYTTVASCSDPSCTPGSGPVALVTFSGILPCGGGDCGWGPNFPDVYQNVMGPTFCLVNTGTIFYTGDQADWVFSNTGYVAAYKTPCGSYSNLLDPGHCVGLEIALGQLQYNGVWYFALSTSWDSWCNEQDEIGSYYYSFFINDARQNMSAAPIVELRNGAAPQPGDSYTADNDQPQSFCNTFPLGDGNTWGYGGSATITFAATCPSGAVLSNSPFHS
jgi:hypothetical protein